MKHKYKLNLSDHGAKIGGAQEVLGQNSQAYDMNLGLSCAEPRVGFWWSLWFPSNSMYSVNLWLSRWILQPVVYRN